MHAPNRVLVLCRLCYTGFVVKGPKVRDETVYATCATVIDANLVHMMDAVSVFVCEMVSMNVGYNILFEQVAIMSMDSATCQVTRSCRRC